MKSELTGLLKLSYEPVAISFTNKKPENAMQLQEGKRGCAAAMLFSAAKGKTAVFDEKTFGCQGGGVGLCFGDTFSDDIPIECLLSTGDEALKQLGKTSKRSLAEGERFFANPELAHKWRSSFPYMKSREEFVVFAPLSTVGESSPPELICFFVNADQLSALVTLSGFNRGAAINAVAPFGAACQSIVFACNEAQKESPNGIIGFMDIAQRHLVPKDMLTYTVPFAMFSEMENSAGESFFVTESWKKIEPRQ